MMNNSLPSTVNARADTVTSGVDIPQLRIRAIFAVWAAAALPMAALAWLAAPVLADRFAGDGIVPMFKALIICLTAGLVWQFVLVAILVGREQRTLRWSTVREALWLRSPRSPRSGRVGGRIWLIVIPLILAVTAVNELSRRSQLPRTGSLPRSSRRTPVRRSWTVPGAGTPSSSQCSCSTRSSVRSSSSAGTSSRA